MNGYIQIGLGGKNRGLKFGNRALLNLMEKHQIKEGIKFSFELLVDLVYFGLLNNCLVKKEDPDFALEDVENWVDDLPQKDLMQVFEVFQKSYLGEDDKPSTTKKTTGKK